MAGRFSTREVTSHFYVVDTMTGEAVDVATSAADAARKAKVLDANLVKMANRNALHRSKLISQARRARG